MKRLTQTLAFCLLTVFTAVAQKNYVSEVWVSDLGNGKYKNPVLYADYSDPDACRVGDDYYMTSSSFNCLPGLQILHSKRFSQLDNHRCRSSQCPLPYRNSGTAGTRQSCMGSGYPPSQR